MANTGIWVKAELDDEGKLDVVIHCAAEWAKDETVTVGEDITDKIPDIVKNSLKKNLNQVIEASKNSLTNMAKDAAVEMSNFKLGKKEKAKLKLDFKGEIGASGSL
jgi:hypothetical protein